MRTAPQLAAIEAREADRGRVALVGEFDRLHDIGRVPDAEIATNDVALGQQRLELHHEDALVP